MEIDIPVLADNTWGTPFFFRSLEHGVDVSIHAGTKYIVGHSDAMLGTVTATDIAHALVYFDRGYHALPRLPASLPSTSPSGTP